MPSQTMSLWVYLCGGTIVKSMIGMVRKGRRAVYPSGDVSM